MFLNVHIQIMKMEIGEFLLKSYRNWQIIIIQALIILLKEQTQRFLIPKAKFDLKPAFYIFQDCFYFWIYEEGLYFKV